MPACYLEAIGGWNRIRHSRRLLALDSPHRRAIRRRVLGVFMTRPAVFGLIAPSAQILRPAPRTRLRPELRPPNGNEPPRPSPIMQPKPAQHMEPVHALKGPTLLLGELDRLPTL
jgi:hypothetical protein